jgi:hypothetical protein
VSVNVILISTVYWPVTECLLLSMMMKICNFFLICIVGGGIKLHSTLRPLNGLLCQPRVIMIMEKSGRGNRSTRRKPVPVPLCPPHAARTRTRAAAVGSQRLTAELRHGQMKICNLHRFSSYPSSAIGHGSRASFVAAA